MAIFAFFDEVHKRFDGEDVLRGLTLHIRKGEALIILGGSGTGKTVILKHIVGLLSPDKGRVYVNERDITGYDENQLLTVRRKVGFLFQNSALFDSMSVFDNVAYPLREHTRLLESEIEQKVKEKLKLVGLEGTDWMMPDKLSGGMRKRVALARAIILEPEALLYDEPTTGLDPITTRWVNVLMRNLHERLHITSVVVTHNIQSAMSVADRIAFLYRGRIKFVGTPEEIKECGDHIVQEFLKS
ncbi:ABC transporter ATP-binding protein [bacterium]|nr:ABC transporter ATP-binding protein [bacterium]RQV93271.1 MAG: ABC transporter ATP-binding protein [bacterium]